MAIVINGSGTVTGISVGGLPDDIVDSGTLANDVVVSTSGAITTTGAFTSIGIDDNADATAITIDSSENVGIGVTPETWHSSYTALQVGAGGAIADWDGTDNGLYLGANWYYDDTNRYIETNEATNYIQEAGIHRFKVAPSGSADAEISWTTAMTIDNSGNTMLGTTTSTLWNATSGTGMSYRNGVALDIAREGSNTAHPCINVNMTGVDGAAIVFYKDGSDKGSIDISGSTTSYNTSSDYRLKENVVPMTGSIDRLKELNPSRFNFIADDSVTVDGFLAHEAQEVVPEAVTGEKDAMRTEEYEVEPAVLDDDGGVVTEAVMGEREVIDAQGIDQSKLVPLLVGALQEAIARIETLENP
jgi:hypothetical protein